MQARGGIWTPEIVSKEFIHVEFSYGNFLSTGNHRDHTVDDIVVEDMEGFWSGFGLGVNFNLGFKMHVGPITMGVALVLTPPTDDILIQIAGVVTSRMEHPLIQREFPVKDKNFGIGSLELTDDGNIKVIGHRCGTSRRNKSIVNISGGYVIKDTASDVEAAVPAEPVDPVEPIEESDDSIDEE